jgi:RimJ/RimL family protein N-acetyltransferase
VAAAQAYVATALRQKAAGDRHPFAIVWHGRVVGSTSYYDYAAWRWPAGSAMQRSDRPDALEIGYTWLAASAQRTQCNTTAKLLLLTHAFETWQVHRVSLRTDVRNARSRRAIERLGAKFEGILRADKPATDQTVRDSARYSIVLAEWAEVRTGLERRLRGA